MRHFAANEAGGAEDSLKERSYDATQRTRFRAVLGEVVGRVALAVAERVASSWSWLSGEARPQPSKGEADGDQSRVRSWLQARKGPIDLEPPDFAAAQPINDVEAIEVAVRRWRISVGQQCWASFVGALGAWAVLGPLERNLATDPLDRTAGDVLGVWPTVQANIAGQSVLASVALAGALSLALVAAPPVHAELPLTDQIARSKWSAVMAPLTALLAGAAFMMAALTVGTWPPTRESLLLLATGAVGVVVTAIAPRRRIDDLQDRHLHAQATRCQEQVDLVISECRRLAQLEPDAPLLHEHRRTARRSAWIPTAILLGLVDGMYCAVAGAGLAGFAMAWTFSLLVCALVWRIGIRRLTQRWRGRWAHLRDSAPEIALLGLMYFSLGLALVVSYLDSNHVSGRLRVFALGVVLLAPLAMSMKLSRVAHQRGRGPWRWNAWSALPPLVAERDWLARRVSGTDNRSEEVRNDPAPSSALRSPES